MLDELDRSHYDSDYKEEPTNQCKFEKEKQYMQYKEKMEEIKFTNDLFSN